MNGAAWHSESWWHTAHANNHHTAAWQLPAILNAALDKPRMEEEMGKPLFGEMSEIIFMATRMSVQVGREMMVGEGKNCVSWHEAAQ